MKRSLRNALIVAGISVVLLLGATLCSVRSPRPTPPPGLALVFLRYSDLDPWVRNVAFLLLTNGSNKSYSVALDDVTDLLTPFATKNDWRQSWVANYELSAHTAGGWSNWTQLTVVTNSWSSRYILPPRSGVVIRVSTPPNGPPRKAAVLVESLPGMPRFWTNRLAAELFSLLPGPLQTRVLYPKPQLVTVWCDQELSHPGDSKPGPG